MTGTTHLDLLFEVPETTRRQLVAGVDNLVSQAGRAVINDTATMDKAADLAKLLRSSVQHLEREQRERTAEYVNTTNRIKGEYSKLLGPLKLALAELRAKVNNMAQVIRDDAETEAAERGEATRIAAALEVDMLAEAMTRATLEGDMEHAKIIQRSLNAVLAEGNDAADVAIANVQTRTARGAHGGSAGIRMVWHAELPDFADNADPVDDEFMRFDPELVIKALHEQQEIARAKGQRLGLKGRNLDRYIHDHAEQWARNVQGVSIFQKAEVAFRSPRTTTPETAR